MFSAKLLTIFAGVHRLVEFVSARKLPVIRFVLGGRRISLSTFLPQLSVLLCVSLGLSGPSLATPGQLDPTFGVSGIAIDSPVYSNVEAHAAVMQPDGKIVLGGGCINAQYQARFCLIRYLPNGEFDQEFGTNGHVETMMGSQMGMAMAVAVTVQQDNKIVAAGLCGVSPYVSCLARYQATGVLDLSFGVEGIVVPVAGSGPAWYTSVQMLSDGRILAAGKCSTVPLGPPGTGLCVARHLSDGTLDASYGVSGQATARSDVSSVAAALAVQVDEKAVVAARCNSPLLPNNAFCVLRFNADGTPDMSFGDNGVAATTKGSSPSSSNLAPLAILLTAGGRIVVGGYCSPGNQSSFCLMRHLADGSLDADFGDSGIVVTPVGLTGGVKSMAVQVDGKLLAAGDCLIHITRIDFCAARYRPDGTLDETFGVGGTFTAPIGSGEGRGEKVLLQSDGNFVIAGYCLAQGARTFCAARFQGGPYATQTCTLNGDGNLALDPSTDALLVTRYLLGYRGDALTTDAVGASPTRTNAEIQTYLGTLMQAGTLDLDGDGQSLAMTDGLLLIRAMLGLAGTALTDGATNAAHPNVRNAQQILTWIESTHGVACLP